MKCIECNTPFESFQPGDKPFCNDECETKFNIAESPVNNWNCMNCNVPLGFEPQMCCNGHECGCRGWPVDPPFCSDECYKKWCETCGNCEGQGWVLINDNGLPNQDKCRDCDGTGKLWTEECQVCGDPVKVNQEYEIITCGKAACHDKIIGRWGI